MDLFSLIACYILSLGVLIFLLLFGEAAIFIGTPIAGLRWLLFSGISEAFWWLTERVAGRQGRQLLERNWDKCATSSTPVLQIFYITLLAVGFYFYSMDIFSFLPQPYAPLWHKYTGTLALGACLVAFYVASVSDPGRITAANLAAHIALYPYDDLTNRRAQQCWTCLWHRPARSKHCPVCNRCIARFDHHCAWINNCVGLLNLKYFLLFLVANMVLCSYGLVLGCIIMHGVLQDRGAWKIMVRERITGRTFLLGSHPRIMLRWMLQNYPVPVAELIFLGVALLLVVSFFGYHVWLISRATTTHETFKWRKVGRRLRREWLAEQVDDQGLEPLHGVRSIWRFWLAFWQSYPQQRPVVLPRNIYDAGVYASWKDALFPPLWAKQMVGVKGRKQS